MTPLLFSVSYAGAWGQQKLGLVPFLEKAAALGYPGVMLGGKRPHLSPVDFPTGDSVCEIKAAAQRLKLDVATIAGYTDFTSGRQAPEVPFVEMQVHYVRHLAQLGKALGAKIVRVFTGYFTDLADHHADWTKCTTALRECAAVCADQGIILGIQNHHDVGVDVGAYAEFLDDVNHPNAKAMFDPWSIGLHGADLYRSAKEMAPRMVQTTLADYIKLPRWQYHSPLINYQPLEPPAVKAVKLGEGFLDLDGFFRGLREGGFSGYVAYEICSPIRGGGEESNLDAAAKHALEKIRGWGA
jgi:sugar phosphate isomerase/epimerase